MINAIVLEFAYMATRASTSDGYYVKHDLQFLQHGSKQNTAESCDGTGPQTTTICVICLEPAYDEAKALPCRHNQFHFTCLGTWLSQSQDCPLCKQGVLSVRYRGDGNAHHVFYPSLSREHRHTGASSNARPRRREPCHSRATESEAQVDEALDSRRCVYRHKLYSSYIGSNQVSGFRNVTPHMIAHSPVLVAKAKKWIRRELRVFDFAQFDMPDMRRTDRRATNAEYLLDYIVAVIKVIDLKGSAGQAQELLKGFLGRENAVIFLHELESWLKSPFQSLQDWDAAMQY